MQEERQRKHGISKEIYEEIKHKVDVKSGDILLVRDGTYLIGTSAVVTEADLPMLFQSHIYRVRVLKPAVISTSAVVTEADLPMLFQSHIYRVRVLKPAVISPWLFFACLNTPIVKRQIRAKQFTQNIIDTLGKRFTEILIPVPRNKKVAANIARETQKIIKGRATLRNRSKAITLELQGLNVVTPEDIEELSEL